MCISNTQGVAMDKEEEKGEEGSNLKQENLRGGQES